VVPPSNRAFASWSRRISASIASMISFVLMARIIRDDATALVFGLGALAIMSMSKRGMNG
jgi:hypothetical protein